MKLGHVKTVEAVGMVLPHDLTRIVQGDFKGAAFKKGHVVRAEDIPLLLEMGKEHIYTLELEDGDLHEDDAGVRLARAASGRGVSLRGPSEGKMELLSAFDGLLKVNVEVLNALNRLPDLIFAALHTNLPVRQGQVLAGTRVIPLVVGEELISEAERLCREAAEPVISVRPFKKMKVGALITGREVSQGHVQDAFGPVLRKKTAAYGLDEPVIRYAPDDAGRIAAGINELLGGGAEIVVVTGGMSVDPDDVTPRGIRLSGAQLVKYGAPVLPGAMFLIAYQGDIPVVGIPACGMYYKTTVFDLIFPRLLAGEKIEAADIVALGHGGLCRTCPTCSYPDCSFGKGGYFHA